MNNVEHKPINYRPDIDGLRTIAVILVILFHIWPQFLTGGFVGVDIFFVISGYLITSIINRELKKNAFSFAGFYVRRMKRILPVFFVVVYLCSAVACLMLLPDDYQKFADSATNASVYFSNMYFFGVSDYFTLGAKEYPLLHTWSLSVEEQYYVFWPLVLFLLIKFTTNKRNWLQPLAIGFLFIFSYLFSIYCINHNQSFGYYSIFSRAFELMLGSILSLIINSDRRLLIKISNGTGNLLLANFLGLIGIALIFISAYFISDTVVFPGWIAIIPTVGAMLVIYSGHVNRKNLISRILATRLFVSIGLISYSMYLWHWPIIAFWHYYYPDTTISIRIGILIACVTVILSCLSYFFVELPIKRKRYNFRQAIIKLHIIPLIPLIVISTVAVNTKGFPARMNSKVYLETKFVDPKYCHSQISGNCTTGNLSEINNPRVLIFGDSHAGALSPFWEELADKYGFAIKHYTDNGCYPLLDSINNLPSSQKSLFEYDACYAQINYVTKNIKDFDVFILVARWEIYFTKKDINFHFADEFANTLNYLVKHGKHVIVFGDIPSYHSGNLIINFLRHSMLQGNSVYPTFVQDDNKKYNNQIEEIVHKYPSVYFFDSDKLLVDSNDHFPFQSGFLLYKDDDHLNQYGSRLLAKQFLLSPQSEKLHKLLESWGVATK